MRAAARLLSSLALSLAAACGGEDGPAAPPPGARVRLWTEAAELAAAPAPPAPSPVFARDFADGLDGFDAVCFPARGEPRVDARVEREGERAFLRLSGVHGGLRAIVPVEPGACYVFTGRVRANAIESDAGAAQFDGAAFWFGETSELATFAELLSTRADLITRSWTGTGAADRDGWVEERKVFVTSPRTRFLHLVCSLAVHHSVEAGSADYADLSLARADPSLPWREALASERALRADVDPSEHAWQAERRVSARLGGEHRPSIVLLPGDVLRFAPLGVPPDAPSGARLALGAGAWRPTALERTEGEATLRVRAGGRELLARSFAARGNAHASRWDDVELPLDPGPLSLELEAAGDAPVVVGAPLLRPATRAPPGPNVLLVSIDTLRADRVGAYGHPGGNTPTLDRLAREGLLCRDTSAQSPYTLPSHATILTGQFPSVHGVVTRGRTLSAARSSSLAETLARAGWTTQAFTAGGFVNAAFGLDRGFDGFADVDPIREPGSHYARSLAAKHGAKGAERLLDAHGFAAVERWLDAHAAERFFLFLHSYTVHDYDAPERYLPCDALGCARPPVQPPRTRTEEESARFTPEMRAHVVHLYDAALRYTDERLGRLLERLAALGIADETLVVVTSDHGEEFFEHGALQHGRTLYEELLGIPLIVAGPGIAPRVLDRPAMQVDVAPTLLARLGLPRDPHMQGVDLLGPAWSERAVWSEVDDRFAHKYALREEDGAKTIHGPATRGIEFPNAREWERYDLAADPGEQRDLEREAASASARAALEKQRRALEELGESLGALGRGGVDADTLRELEELGYGGGGDEGE